jgi:Tol biopolymer transport system component
MKKILAAVLFVVPKMIYGQMSAEHWLPPVSPGLFNEVSINTAFRERDFALSPDGTEIFYTLQSPKANFQTIIYLRKDAKGKWGPPEVAPFSGKFTDLEPAFTMDGKRLFFVSNRPVTGVDPKDFDIWFVDKQEDKWGQPKNAGQPVNGPLNEFYPSICANGNLYFTCNYRNSTGGENIYVSVFKNGKYSIPIALDSGVNSQADEFNAFVSPDEQFIIFSSYGRKDDKGGGDLYMSRKNNSGQWMPAKNLEMLNSERLDYCPFVSFDGKSFFFTSERFQITSHDQPATYSQLINEYSSLLNGGGNIYWVSFEEVLKYLN